MRGREDVDLKKAKGGNWFDWKNVWLSDGECWQKYGGKVEGPGRNTGRRGGNKAHLFSILFLAVRFLACLLLLSLSCVGCCVVVVFHRKQPSAGGQAQSGQSVGSAKSSSQKEGGVPRPKRAATSRKGLWERSLICKVELLDSQGHSGGNHPPVRLIEFELIELGGVKEVVAVLNTIQNIFSDLNLC